MALAACFGPWPGLARTGCLGLVVLFALPEGWRPGLALAVAAIPFSFLYFPHIGLDVSAADILIVTAFTGRALAGLGRWLDSRSRCPRSPGRQPATSRITSLDGAVLLFVVASLLSRSPARSGEAWAYAFRLLVLQPAMLYVLIRAGGLSRRELVGLSDALVLGATLLSLAGLSSYYCGSGFTEQAEGVRRLMVPFFDSPNHIALLLIRVIPLAFCLAAYGRPEGVARRTGYGLALVPLVACLVLTDSQGALLIGLPAAMAFVALTRRRRGRVLAAGALAVTLLLLLPHLAAVGAPWSWALPGFGVGDTLSSRLILWLGTLRMIAARPLLGVGLGNFQYQYPSYMLLAGWREPLLYHAHNVVLDFWSMLGIPGMVALAWMLIAFFRTAAHNYTALSVTSWPSLPGGTRSAAGAWVGDARAMTLGLMAGMVAGIAHGLVDTTYFLADLALVFMFALGIAAALRGIEDPEEAGG